MHVSYISIFVSVVAAFLLLSTVQGAQAYEVASEDKSMMLELGGIAQFDARYFAEDRNHTGKNTLITRRLRPIAQGRAGIIDFRLVPDIADGEVRVMDAYAELPLQGSMKMRAGKFKPPVGLERLQSGGNLLFNERGLATNLAPNRDIGVQLQGEIIPERLEYQVGVFNGDPDLSTDDSDQDQKKDIAARLFGYPLPGLGVGVGGSIGSHQGDSNSHAVLSDYRSPGQQRIFRHSNGAFAHGTQWRLVPQATYYQGPFGAMAEYAFSSQEVERSGTRATLEHKAWSVAASYVLTGEDAGFKGVVPAENVSLEQGGMGAWEIAVRLGNIRFDPDSFPLYASAAQSAEEATAAALGLNWYLNPNVKWQANYERTKFDGGAAAGQDRPDEHALFTRIQYQF